MKILVVGQYFYPDNFRINEIAQELVKRGHRVTVLTGLPDYATGRVPKEYRHGRRRRETIEGVEVIRVPIIARRTGVLWRALNYLSFLISSSLYVSFHKLDCDVVFCYQTSPVSMAQAAVKAKKKTGKKLVLYCLDIWPECLKAWRVSESSPLFKVVHRYSRYIYGRCDTIAISSKPFREYLTRVNGVKDEKIVYLPQHTDEVVQEKGIGPGLSGINLAFGGNIGSVQDVECIVKATSLVKDIPNLTVHIFGDGSNLEACRALAREGELGDRLRFYGRVAREELKKYYLDMDAFLLTLKAEGSIGLTVPAKLQEYMAWGKPILGAIGGAAAEIIEEASCGHCVAASDSDALAATIRLFVSEQSGWREMGERAGEYYRSHFTKENFLSHLEEMLTY